MRKKNIFIMFFILAGMVFCGNVDAKTTVDKVSIANKDTKAEESLDSWMPDKNLQKAVFQNLNGVIEDPSEITKELIATELYFVTIDGSVDKLDGLEFATELYNVDIEDFKGKTIDQLDITPLGKLDKEIFIFYNNMEDPIFKDGNLKVSLAQFLKYPKIGFGTEITPLDLTIKIDENNYKQFDVPFNSFYKSIFDQEIISFTDEYINYNFSTGSLIYKVSYDETTNSLKFVLEEEYSDDVAYEIIEKESENLKAPDSKMWFSDDYFMANRPDNLSIGSFALSAKLQARVAKQVIVKHVDKGGNSLADNDIVTGKLDKPYTTSAKTIKGYKLKTTPSNNNGIFTDQVQEVIYVYEKITEQNQSQSVIVKYVDTDNKDIHKQLELKGKFGKEYKTSPLDIKGYKLKTEPSNKNGKFSDKLQYVVYTYEKDSKSPIDIEGKLPKTGTKLNNIFAISSLILFAVSSLYISKTRNRV